MFFINSVIRGLNKSWYLRKREYLSVASAARYWKLSCSLDIPHIHTEVCTRHIVECRKINLGLVTLIYRFKDALLLVNGCLLKLSGVLLLIFLNLEAAPQNFLIDTCYELWIWKVYRSSLTSSIITLEIIDNTLLRTELGDLLVLVEYFCCKLRTILLMMSWYASLHHGRIFFSLFKKVRLLVLGLIFQSMMVETCLTH